MSAEGLLSGLAPWPSIDFTQYGPVETRPLTRYQKLTGAFLARNWVAIPHVTHHDDADITDTEMRRKAYAEKSGAKISLPVVLVKVLARALVAFPQFNSSIDVAAGTLVLKSYVNIGVAVDTPNGLLVPVLRDADTRTLAELAADLESLAALARTKGLPLSDMSGGCMTLSSLGHIGGTAFTPIINAPEVAILGAVRARAQATPGPDGSIQWRTMLPLSLSYDHRVINGADAARFCRFIADTLADPGLFD